METSHEKIWIRRFRGRLPKLLHCRCARLAQEKQHLCYSSYVDQLGQQYRFGLLALGLGAGRITAHVDTDLQA